jgi:hypothetical protein
MLATIGEIESEAEKLIEETRGRAGHVLHDAGKKAGEILSSEFPVDESRIERDKIINTAEKEANKQIENSKRQTLQIKADALAKADETVKLIVNYIRGVY